MITAILVDDEQSAIDTLTIMLKEHCPQIHCVGKASNIIEAQRLLDQLKPDLCFLDIHMPRGSGLELIEKYGGNTSIVFTTAFSDYSIKAIRLSAFDYLLKPIDYRELVECVRRFENKKQHTEQDIQILMELLENDKIKRISISTSEGYDVINLNALVCCEAARSYTIFHLEGGDKVVSSKPIGEYDQLLVDSSFLRIHRSYLINLNHVKSYKKGRGGEITLTNGLVVEVSRHRKEELLRRLA